MLAGEGVLIDFIAKAEIQEAVLLGDQERRLPGEFLPLGAGVLLSVAGLRGEHQAEPVADFRVLHFHPAEEFEHLPIQFGFRYPHAGMPRSCVPAASVVDVTAIGRALESLDDLFTGNGTATVAADHELAGEGHLVSVVDMPAEERLDTIPRLTLNKRLLLAGVPLPLERNLADVGPVRQDRVQLAPREPGSVGPVSHAVCVQAIAERIERERLVCVEVEDSLDFLRRFRVDFRL